MAKTNKKPTKKSRPELFDENIRFIVPMPGKSAWQSRNGNTPLQKMHFFSNASGDFPLEDYQAQFLMQREYLID